MPEAPELDAAAARLRELAAGRTLTRLDIAAFSVLRTAQPPADSLIGRELSGVGRRGKHLLFDFEGRTAVLHLALAGWLRHHPTAPRGRVPHRGPLALRLTFDDGSALDVTEQGTKKSAALWVSDEPSSLPTLARLGPEAGELAEGQCEALLRATSAQAKTVLTDQERMAGIGNAWSDEILHRARLSPFAAANRLGERTGALCAGLAETLEVAHAGLDGVPLDKLKAAKKKLLRVHGRTGQPCPVCGTAIAEVSFAERSLQYCPGCQTGGRRLSDRRMDRLLK